MSKKIPAVRRAEYDTIAQLRAKGVTPDRIAKLLGISEAEVRSRLDYLTDRYRDVVTRNGTASVLAEQAMAIEASMEELSRVAKGSKGMTKIQAIRAREELRRTWLDVCAKAGMLPAENVPFFDAVAADLTPEQKKALAKLGLRRLLAVRDGVVTRAVTIYPRRRKGSQASLGDEKVAEIADKEEDDSEED